MRLLPESLTFPRPWDFTDYLLTGFAFVFLGPLFLLAMVINLPLVAIGWVILHLNERLTR